jgi:hypothetical protein
MALHLVSEMEYLAYLDGQLSEQDRVRVEAHLAECPACAAELDRLRTLQKELGATLDAALAPVRLSVAADRRIRERLRTRAEPRPWWRLWQQRGLLTQALLAVLVLAFALNTTRVLSLPPAPMPQETLVLGQDEFAPGSQAALRVVVRTAGETLAETEPIQGATVIVRIGRTPGLASIVYTGRTDSSGTTDVSFAVPEDLEGEASLVVETSSASGEDQIVRPITIARDYKLFLSSDKPAYRPGQEIHLRALALDAVDLKPATGQEVVFVLFGPDDENLKYHVTTTSDFGIAALDFDLPATASHGQYTLQAALGDTISERTVTVDAYDLPDFRVTIETDRPFYAPGERVTGLARAEYFFGEPVAEGEVILHGYTEDPDRTPAVQILGQTDAEGRFKFAFDLPSSFGLSAVQRPRLFDLEAEIVDTAGQREGISHLFAVAAQPVFITAIPESGLLKPGIENAIFILTSYPNGQPVEATLTVTVDGQEHTLTGGPYGLAEFRHTPTGMVTDLDVRARDSQGAEGRAAFTFENDRADRVLLLRAERAAYEVGDTLRAEALAAGMEGGSAQTVYLDVIRAQQTVATLAAPVEDGRAVFALDLDETMVGTLELHAYYLLADGGDVRDTRLVMVDMPRQVAVAVTADREKYNPGDTAHLQFQTTTATTDQPVQSALGIGVVDESVYALETLPPGFARAYLLMEQELRERHVQGLSVPALLDAEAETELRNSQDAAAQAAWAGVQGTPFTLSETSTVQKERDLTAQIALANRLGSLLVLLPLFLSVVVVRGLGPTGVLREALRRVGIGGLVLFVASPLVALVGGGVIWLLRMALGVGAFVLVLLAVVALLVRLAVHGWRRRDTRVQLATGLLAAYLIIGGLLVTIAARDGDPAGILLILIVIAFLLAVAMLATLGQGLVLEGWSRAGWVTTALAFLLVPLVIYLPFVPDLDSGLTQTLGNPTLYAGPVGWLTGCGVPAATEEPVATAPAEEVEVPAAPTEAPPPAESTDEPEVTEEPPPPTAPPTSIPTFPAPATPAPLPTATPAPAATVTPPPMATPMPATTATPPPSTPLPTSVPIPAEPFPLRQVFPETLYWSAESLTDEDGNLALDLPLADNVTTWRLTTLASTREGNLGVATYDLVVFQGFFIDLDLPAIVGQGEEITATVTLYNYSERAQTVYLEPAPAGWYTLLPGSDYALVLPANTVTTAHLFVRAEQPGEFDLQVAAVGDHSSDAVIREVTVETP